MRRLFLFLGLFGLGCSDDAMDPDAAVADASGPTDSAVGDVQSSDTNGDVGDPPDIGPVLDVGVDVPQTDAGNACARPTAWEDPFDELRCWTERNFEHAAATIEDGRLHLRFAETSPARNGWFGDDEGPALTQRAQGDFFAMVYVDAHRVTDASAPPQQGFNSAGLLLRDPASGPGTENWIMWNTGFQGGGNCAGGPVDVGSEGKTTVNSDSTLCLTPGSHRGRLALCRVGPDVRLLRNLEGDAGWMLLHEYDRPDLPSEVDVGLLTNGWAAPPDLHAEFDDFQVGPVADLSECTEATFDARFP